MNKTDFYNTAIFYIKNYSNQIFLQNKILKEYPLKSDKNSKVIFVLKKTILDFFNQNKKNKFIGQGRIRTFGIFNTPVFKTGTLNRSDTHPCMNFFHLQY